LNLRRTGFCVPMPIFLIVRLIGWVTLHETVEVYSVSVNEITRRHGSSTKLSYRPTKPLEMKIVDLCVSSL
jgi:hypothetical protein